MNKGLKLFDPVYAALDGVNSLFYQCLFFYIAGGVGHFIGLIASDCLYASDIFMGFIGYPWAFLLSLATGPGISLGLIIPVLFIGMILFDWSFTHAFFLVPSFQALGTALRRPSTPEIYIAVVFSAVMLLLYAVYLIRRYKFEQSGSPNPLPPSAPGDR